MFAHTPFSLKRRLGALLVLVSALAWAAPAAGQSALGDGRQLDANPLVGSDGRNPQGFTPDFRSRNMLITGNVIGGRGFQDTVGYTAAEDFRGELGSDDLFSFQAGAAWSNPALFAAGQTLDMLRFGQQLNVVEYRRAGTGATVETLGMRESNARLDADRLVLDKLSLMASDNLIYKGAIEPQFVGMFQSQDGQPLVASVSSLRGLQVTQLAGQPQLLGLTPLDVAKTREDAAAGEVVKLGEPFAAGFDNLIAPDLRTDAAVGTGPLDTRVESTKIDPLYRGILERVADRYAQATEPEEPPGELASQLDEAFARLREELGAEPPPEGAEEQAPDTAGAPGLSIDDFGVILQHGETIEHYAVGDPGRFLELMAEGEEMLKRGEYFWAERRFTRALRFTPGHPIATAGLAHAQIGAGLNVSAALALRRLVTRHPEMLDVRYGPELLPNRVRLNVAVRALEEDIAAFERDRDLNGFLLAYVGHQLDDRALIERGLQAIEEAAPDDPLLPLLRRVWLGEE